jgi:serine/threonine protein kinase
LPHPNIVQIYDIGEIDVRIYLSLEYGEGGSLYRFTREGLPHLNKQ